MDIQNMLEELVWDGVSEYIKDVEVDSVYL